MAQACPTYVPEGQACALPLGPGVYGGGDPLTVGSCHYDGDELLSTASDFLCPTYVPEGQACALPLGPGVYGGGDPLTVGPIESIPDILLPFLKGTVRAEATVTD